MEESTRARSAGTEGSAKTGVYDPNVSSSVNAGATPSKAFGQTDEYNEQGKWSGTDRYGQARQTFAGASGQAQRAATEWMQQTRVETDAYVREKPWTAIGVAAGVGFLVGVMLRR